MTPRQRQHEILTLLDRQRFATVENLTRVLNASEATVRRDITALAARGQINRMRGGAERAATTAPGLQGQPLNISQTLRVAEKRGIGRAAAALCRAGDSLAINGGSTTGFMAQFLPTENLHVLTNALPIADHLIRQTRNRVIMPGGEIYREQNIILSPFDDDAMDNFHAARVFFGAQSIGPRGLMESDSILIRAVRTLMRQSDEVIGLMDSSKFSSRGNLILCELDALDILVTDSGITRDQYAMLVDAGVEVIVAEPEPLYASA